jgi:CubicO group peptidase (beta-lactamase class C family)
VLFRKFFMTLSAGYLLSACPLACANQYQLKNYLADAKYPDTYWKFSGPERAGMDSGILQQSLSYIRQHKLEIHSFLVIKNGKIVFEQYGKEKKDNTFFQHTPADKHELHSVTKTITAGLLGIAVEKKFINSIQEKAVDFFNADDLNNVTEQKKSITLENLLTMQSGLEYSEGRDDPLFFDKNRPISALAVLNQPMAAEPNTLWNYSSGNSQIIAEILRRRTKKTPLDFAMAQVFSPLGINNIVWNADNSGTNFGGWGLFLTPRDLARVGYLYLQQGRWNEQQLIPKEWITTSTQFHVKSIWGEDQYAYHSWVLPGRGFAAFGYMGQAMIVLPKYNTVVIFTAALPMEIANRTLTEIVEKYVVAAMH